MKKTHKLVSESKNIRVYKTPINTYWVEIGRNIIAYEDELSPGILIQVKVNKGILQALKETLDEGDYADYTKNVKICLQKHSIIKSMNWSELIDLILYYR